EVEPEIDGAREVLLGAVEAMHPQQLFGPQHAERLADLGADLVLAAVPPGQRHQRRPHPASMAEHREETVVLVVGMRVGLHEGAGARQLPEQELEGDAVGPLAEGRDAQLRFARSYVKGEQERERKSTARHIRLWALGLGLWVASGS